MTVPVLRVVMGVRMCVPGPVCVGVLVLVKCDLEMTSEGIGDAAQRFQAGDVIATLQARDHRLGHAQPRGQLLLGLAGIGPEFQQLPRALSGKCVAVVFLTAFRIGSVAVLHDPDLAKVRMLAGKKREVDVTHKT